MNITVKITNKNPLLELRISPLDAEIWETKKTREHTIAKGYIKLDSYRQVIKPNYGWWTLDDYKRQWKEGLERIKTKNRSCLVTNFGYLNGKPTVTWWLLYKIDNNIHAQERFSFERKKPIDHEFTPENCYEFIPPRRVNDDGQRKLEYIIPINKIGN